jgi:hypothetical protein
MSNVAGWPTPTAHEFEPRDVKRMLERRERIRKKWKNNGFGMTLGQIVHVVIKEEDVPRIDFEE